MAMARARMVAAGALTRVERHRDRDGVGGSGQRRPRAANDRVRRTDAPVEEAALMRVGSLPGQGRVQLVRTR